MEVLSEPVRSAKARNAAALILAVLGAIALLYYGRLFFITLITAVVIAFILEPFVELLGRVRVPRVPASFLVCAVALLILYLGGLGLYTQVAGLGNDLPKYQQRINDLADQVILKVEAMEKAAYSLLVPKRFREEPAQPPPAAPPPKTSSRRQSQQPKPVMLPPPPLQEVRIRPPEQAPLLSYLASHLGSLYETVLMASFVPFLVYFMLSWQDHLRRRFLQIFEEHARETVARSLAGIASMVRAFVVGNFLLGLMLTAASALVFYLFWLPYPLLMGSLSGFLSLIPYIGLPLAILPPVITALPVFDSWTPYLLIGGIVAMFHLIAINVLYPKIVGPRVHLNPLVVTIALMAWSALWGAAGLILAIPLTAAIKAVCDHVKQLQPYGKLLGD